MDLCSVLQPGQAGAWLPAQLPWAPGKAEGGVLGPGAPAASSAGRAWGMLMHTCSVSASSEAQRAGRLLGFCGTASSLELWEGPFHVQECNLSSHRALMLPGRGGWMWPCPPCLLKLGQRVQRQVVHAARRWPNP